MNQQIGLLGIPSSAGAFAPGQEKAPKALRDEDLIEHFQNSGHSITDYGDTSTYRWTPDDDHPYTQNVDKVVRAIREGSDRVTDILDDGALPLVVGGDCTVGLGTIAGISKQRTNLGVVYFDLHPDLNTPDSTNAGALDWMGMAHALGIDNTVESFCNAGPQSPLLKADDVVFFSYGPENCTEWEQRVMENKSLTGVPVDEVDRSPVESAQQAIESLGSELDSLVVHFDIDTVDFLDLPLSENGGRNEGLTLQRALEALEVFLNSPNFSALTITEMNPDHGVEDGSTVQRFIKELVACWPKIDS